MILNGKAKEDFEKWYFENHCSSNIKFEDLLPHHIYDVFGWLYKQSLTIQNALIIEFFDYKNIFIEVSGIFYQGFEPEFNYNIQEKGTLNGINGEVFNSRQEATIQAIKQAIKIYNERFK